MHDRLLQNYRYPEDLVDLSLQGALSKHNGYFKFGKETVCYGETADPTPAKLPATAVYDALLATTIENGSVQLPFDLDHVVDGLRNEVYASHGGNGLSPLQSAIRSAYYFFRPLLPVEVRKYLQQVRLRDWDKLQFPKWPVDLTVEKLFEQVMLLTLRAQGLQQIPFIWFWPDGASSCAIMTHDVETGPGRDFCSTLMDINDSFGIKASFQVVPERRYEVPSSYLESIRSRNFELNVQDLNHDGHLFRDRKTFLERVKKINAYGREYGAVGFRSAVLYRRQEWYDALEFSYDTSVPNVAHLDPQRGGCCTVMPYFVGRMLELPVTTTQDYSLFHILNDHTIDLWKRQMDMIMEKHGLMNFIVHPDYITSGKERQTYENLLEYVEKMRTEKNVWTPLPRDVDSWWRQRMQMKLVEDGGGWRIEGPGKERARVAYASEQDGRLVVELQSSTAACKSEFASPSRKS
jgi:hypothetical protein